MINFRIKILVTANNLNKKKKANLSTGFLLLAGDQAISNFIEGYDRLFCLNVCNLSLNKASICPKKEKLKIDK